MFSFLKSLTIILIVLCFVTPVCSQVQYSNLPTIYITTQNNQSINSKTTYVPGRVVVVSSDNSESIDLSMQIRGRGNSTWNMPKKPYRLKLDSKFQFLNLPANERDWTLIANYADKTLIRNALAFRIGEIVGLPFNPSARFVDLVVNNQFMGNYMVSDHIEVGRQRVNVRKQSANDTEEPAITGGYLLEIDGFAATEAVWFTTSMGLKITVKSPDDSDINQQQLTYIRNYINQFESRLFSSNFTDPVVGYRSLVDSATLINWYIASELTGNSDCFWSTYIYKHVADDKLYFGPLWDYDIAFNNDRRLGDAVEKRMSDAAHNPRTWIQRFLQDEWFVSAVWKRWQELNANNLHAKLISFITETAELIDESQKKNFERWNNLGTRVYQETFLFNTYQGGIDYLKTYIGNRINFLNTSFFFQEPEKPSVTFVPGNYYYMIMNKRTNNTIDVEGSSVLAEARMVMWEPRHDVASQLWEFRQVDEEWFRIINKNSGLAMTGNGRGTNLIQKQPDISDNRQLWKVVPVLTGDLYGIVNKHSGYTINNSGGNFANGTNTIEWDNNITGSQNQQWFLNKIEDIPVSGTAEHLWGLENITFHANPSTGEMVLRMHANDAGVMRISVYDVSGKIVYKNSHFVDYPGNKVFSLPLNHLNSGVYLLRSELNGHAPVTIKILLNNR